VLVIAMALSQRFAVIIQGAVALLALGGLARWAWRRGTPGALASAAALPVSIGCGAAAFMHVKQSLPTPLDPLELVPLKIGCTFLAFVAFPHAWSAVIALFWAKELWACPEPARRVTRSAKVITVLVLGSVLAGIVAQRLVLHLMPELARLAGAG